MYVTDVRVSFLREKQPVQYEKATPAVEFAAKLDEGENHLDIARQLMIDATTIVYAGIGYSVPERIVEALSKDEMPDNLEVSVMSSMTEVDVPVKYTDIEVETEAITVIKNDSQTVVDTDDDEVPGDEPKRRGRPKGSKNTAPKKGTKAAEEADAAVAAKANGHLDDVVPSDDEKQAISTGDGRVGPDDDPADHDEDAVPGDDEAVFTARDLQEMFRDLTNPTSRKLSVANVKQVLSHFRVARASDLTGDQVLEAKDMIEKMVLASGK